MATSLRAGANLGAEPEEEPDFDGEAGEPELTLTEFLLTIPREEHTVTIPKETSTTRIGIGLRADMPERAVVNTTAPGTPASESLAPGSQLSLIEPFDEILQIGGVPCESAVHAVKLIREAPAGDLVILKRGCPEGVKRATNFLQASWRTFSARRDGLTQRILTKPQPNMALGISFSPEYQIHSLIAAVKEDGLAVKVLSAGDRIVRINGIECIAPADAARTLRAASGRIHLELQLAADVDVEEMREAEAAHAAEEERARQVEQGGDYGYEDDPYSSDDDANDDIHGGMNATGDLPREDDSPLAPRQANLAGQYPFPASPERPSALSVSAGRRRPASLASPDGAMSEEGSPLQETGMPASTSSTRAAVPLATGRQPAGWREWLQQKKSTAAVKPRDAAGAPSPSNFQQRV